MYEKELEEIVRSAGAMLIENIGALQITKKGRANFVTQMDVAVQEYIRKKLYELDPLLYCWQRNKKTRHLSRIGPTGF